MCVKEELTQRNSGEAQRSQRKCFLAKTQRRKGWDSPTLGGLGGGHRVTQRKKKRISNKD
jgi:hypothetical protein